MSQFNHENCIYTIHTISKDSSDKIVIIDKIKPMRAVGPGAVEFTSFKDIQTMVRRNDHIYLSDLEEDVIIQDENCTNIVNQKSISIIRGKPAKSVIVQTKPPYLIYKLCL